MAHYDLFSEFGPVTVFGVIEIIDDFQAHCWSSWVTRISGKMKKANKGHEGQSKARESTIPKFFHINWTVRYPLFTGWIVFVFQGH